MKETIQNLFSSINYIINKYEAIFKITGEDFNIFRLLKIEMNEVRLHSTLIAELLNPKGKHNQGSIFLKEFCNVFNIKEMKDDIDFEANVCVEEHAGGVDYDLGLGGRIDIIVKTKSNKAIIIENKLNAIDQHLQLVRYKNQYKNCYLIYLTLNGKEPDLKSTQHKEKNIDLKNGIDYYTASYETDILKWLVICKKEVVNYPLLRETISQYINLINYLTNQTMNQNMKDEIVKEITSNGKNISAAIELSKLYTLQKKGL